MIVKLITPCLFVSCLSFSLCAMQEQKSTSRTGYTEGAFLATDADIHAQEDLPTQSSQLRSGATEGGHKAVVNSVLRGDTEGINRMILNAKIDINSVNNNQMDGTKTVLMQGILLPTEANSLSKAISRGDTEEITALIRSGANVNTIDPELKCTPLLLAVARGERAVVQQLLRVPSVDVTAVTLNGKDTVVTLAACFGRTDILSDLLNSHHGDTVRSFVNERCESKQTALIAAASLGYLETVKLLLTIPGIDVNASDAHGDTALTKAVKAHQNATEVVTELLKVQNLDVNAVNRLGQTALTLAVNCKRLPIIQLLFHDARPRTIVAKTDTYFI